MRSKILNIRLLPLLFLSLLSLQLTAADAKLGKTLFTNNCASCHAKDMKSKLTGPALAGVQGKWENQADLYKWIRNSQAMIAAGHPRAVQLWNEYKPTVMTAFPTLTDEDIDNILAYVTEVEKGGGKTAAVAAAATGGDEPKEESNGLLYGVAFAILSALALVLARIINNLNKTAAEKEGKSYVDRTWVDTLTSKGVVGFVIFALIVLGGYTTVNNAIALGRSQNYAPVQPVKFSHKIHAGQQKIECQYCHDGARRSKHSVIPATNTCMNCHKAVKVGTQSGTSEITKIFVSAGWDPSTGKNIDNYESLKEEEIAAIYKKWIVSQFVEKRGLSGETSDAKLFAESEWQAIATSLKTPTKEKIQGPIEWVRIHNLPDHVYFNHAQHVTVGKVACQTCHGTVEKMDVLKQHAPLSMGWCINCHRETEVKFKDNDYYQHYERYHEELKAGRREKVTVEDIGGLECQKCHY